MFSRYYLAPRDARETPATYSESTIADTDLEAYWRCGDTGGTATDETGSYDSTIPVGITTGQPGLIGDGDLAFVGSGTASIDVSTINPWSGDFTIECWAREEVDIDDQYRGLVCAGTFETNGFRFGRTLSRWAFWTDQNGGDFVLDAGADDVTLDETVHLVVARSSATFTLYKNGSQIATTSNGTAYVAPGAGCSLVGASGLEWKSTIDEIAVYTAEKDSAWVAARYALAVPPATETPYAVDTLSNGDLEAYWRLGDTGATVTDSGPNGYDMTKGPEWTTGTSALIDDSDAAMTGFGNYALGTAAAGLNPWSSAFTVEAWAKTAATTGGYKGIFGTGTYLTNGFRFGRLDGADGWAFWTDQSHATGFVLKAGTTPSTTVGYHLVATYDGVDAWELYVNGTLVDSTTSTNYTAASGGCTVGAFSGGSGDWHGDLDEVAVYSVAQGSAWVAARYALGAP